MSQNKYYEGMILIKHEVIALQENYLEDLFKLIIQYYNFLEKHRSILLEKDRTNWKYNLNEDESIKIEYNKFHQDLKKQLEEMLESVYSLVSQRIREIYGDLDYPISKIQFFNKDGLTIDDRIDKWWNPYNDKKLNQTFIKNKLVAESKIAQINKAEALNQTEVLKYDKLFKQSKQIEITNEDEEDDCADTLSCEIYWGKYSIEDDDLPPLPIYHPDCECFTVYYF